MKITLMLNNFVEIINLSILYTNKVFKYLTYIEIHSYTLFFKLVSMQSSEFLQMYLLKNLFLFNFNIKGTAAQQLSDVEFNFI